MAVTISKDNIMAVANQYIDIIDENSCEKYTSDTHHEYCTYTYTSILNFCEKRGFKNVLDFGCGVGYSQKVYEKYSYDFNLTLCDVDYSWKEDEKSTFDYYKTKLGVDNYISTDITKDNFNISCGSQEFDAVIFFRFPPLTKLKVSPDQIRKKLEPYTTKNFSILYVNVPRQNDDPIWDIPHKEKIIHKSYKILVF